jgi:hypothetical protein
MLEFVPKNQPSARAKRAQRVKDLDEWQSRLVRSFINNLFGPGTLTTDEMEVAA